MKGPLPAFAPPREVLDDLEVLRHGLYGPGATMHPLPVPVDLARGAVAAGALLVTDAEGAPVARVTDPERTADDLVGGRPQWLGEPPDRPFRALHLSTPVDLSRRRVVLVRPSDGVPAPLPPDAFLLVLASTSVDGPAAATATVRAALAAAGGDPARVGVVPVPLADPDRLRALLATLGVDPGSTPATGPDAGPTVAPGDERGAVVLLTGLSGSGKSTLARAVATRLVEEGTPVTLLDGDVVRRHLTAGLGFSAADRATNVRRIGWVAAEVAHHGGVAVCSPIAPEDAVRRELAATVRERGGRFVLVHVSTPLEECERRDRKGLYAAARRGEVADLTGVSAPYDVPEDPELRIDTTGRDVSECADLVLDLVHDAHAVVGRA